MSRFFRLLSAPRSGLSWMEKIWISALAMAILLTPFLVHAEEMVAARTIVVSGDAEVKKAPDKADINISIQEENKSLDEARRLTEAQLKSLYRITKELGISEKDMKTSYSSVQPVYDYNNGKQTFRAYSVNHQIQITLRKLDQLAVLTEKLLDARIDQIDNVLYGLQDENDSKDEALKKALERAKLKASAMASAYGESLGRVIQINESGVEYQPIPMPMVRKAFAMEAADSGMIASAPPAPPPLPTPTGEISINATVNVTFALKN